MSTKTSNSPLLSELCEIFVAEILGTGFLMFSGCIGHAGNLPLLGRLSNFPGATIFGCTIASIVVIFGPISNAHLNPCVTICAAILNLITPLSAVIYVLAQLIGATIGFSLLKSLLPDTDVEKDFCNTSINKSISITQGFTLEFIITMFLILLVCSMWHRQTSNVNIAALNFGIYITLAALTVGPLTGASMNPVRSLIPAIINNVWTNHWVYWVAPLTSTIIATLFYKIIFMDQIFHKIFES